MDSIFWAFLLKMQALFIKMVSSNRIREGINEKNKQGIYYLI